jgi:hypothetical protein
MVFTVKEKTLKLHEMHAFATALASYRSGKLCLWKICTIESYY